MNATTQIDITNKALPSFVVRLTFSGDDLIDLSFIEASLFHNSMHKLTQEQKRCIDAVVRYLKNGEPLIGMKIHEKGTAFQKRVWSALRTIPYGQTVTYGQLAEKLDSGARAVANACRHNPIALVTPCHRVVSANGIGGFMGQNSGNEIDLKQWLINHERT